MSQLDKVPMEKIEEIANELYDVEQGLNCTIELIGQTDTETAKIKGLLECFRKALAGPVDKIWDIVNG